MSKIIDSFHKTNDCGSSRDIDALQAAIIDLLDGGSPHEIVKATGMSEERAEEIWLLGAEILTDYNKRHGIA